MNSVYIVLKKVGSLCMLQKSRLFGVRISLGFRVSAYVGLL